MATPMYPVVSSQLSYVGYENDTNELYITFKNGTTYKYENVPIHVFNELINATSVGKYFTLHIKNSYINSKIK
jgi:hypothetical protein